jgi:predicted aspartyl protease
MVSYDFSFDVPGRVLHCPMVTVSIGGCVAKLIVDTGATSHVLTTDLIDRAGLRRFPGQAGRDVAGDEVESWTVGDVAVQAGGRDTVVLRDVAAIAAPESFLEWGVGGFLSPQCLASEATVVIDLIANRLHVSEADPDGAAAEFGSDYPQCLLLEGSRHSAGTLGIEVRVPPGPTVVAIFDTGSAQTEVASIAVATAIDAAPTSSGRGVGGRNIDTKSLADQELTVGSARLRVPVLHVRSEIPGPQDAALHEVPNALLGMDLLRGTALALGIPPRSGGTLWWAVPHHLLNI